MRIDDDLDENVDERDGGGRGGGEGEELREELLGGGPSTIVDVIGERVEEKTLLIYRVDSSRGGE